MSVYARVHVAYTRLTRVIGRYIVFRFYRFSPSPYSQLSQASLRSKYVPDELKYN